MTRPTQATIANTLGWDIPVDGNFTKIFGTPYPPPEFADYASLPTATSYDGCVAWLLDEECLVFSTSGAWERMGWRSANQADSTAVTVAALVIDFNALLAKLQASNQMS